MKNEKLTVLKAVIDHKFRQIEIFTIKINMCVDYIMFECFKNQKYYRIWLVSKIFGPTIFLKDLQI